MKPDPKVIQVNEQELRAKLLRIEEVMGGEFADPFRQLLDGHVTIWDCSVKNISIKRLQKLSLAHRANRVPRSCLKRTVRRSRQRDIAAVMCLGGH
jgi:hypothetical protein